MNIPDNITFADLVKLVEFIQDNFVVNGWGEINVNTEVFSTKEEELIKKVLGEKQ